MRVMIVSQPKSGTYLTSALLVQWGMEQTYMHINNNGYQRYDPERLDEGRESPSSFTHLSGLKLTMEEIPEGGFGVSHLPALPNNIEAFKGFKKILLTRPYDECAESAERFQEKWRRGQGPGQASQREWIAKWEHEEDVFHLTFKDLITKNITKLDACQVFLFGEVLFDSDITMQAALDTETLTKNR